MSTRLQVKLTKENYRRVEKRANYLGTSLTSIILLTYYLYQDTNLNEAEIEKQLSKIQKKSEDFKVAINITDSLEDILKYKQRYFYTLTEYLSAFLNNLLEASSDEWKESNSKQIKKRAIYSVDKDLNEWITAFSKRIGVGQTTLFNYALLFDKATKKLCQKTPFTNKEEKGFYLIQENIDYLKELTTADKKRVLNSCICYYKKIEE